MTATTMTAARPGPPLLQFRHLLHAGARHGVSTRHGGGSPAPFAGLNLSVSVGDTRENVVANRAAICRVVGVPPERLRVPGLVHEATVRRVDTPEGWADPLNGVDALMAVEPGAAMLVTCADCAPVLLFDPETGAAGVAHAGWRGTLLDIAGELARAMARELGAPPERLLAGIGPGIGPCCYDVGPNVVEAALARFPDGSVLAERAGATYFDIPEANRRFLIEAGVRREHIATAPYCTGCHTDLFYSHRAERGRTGRFGAVIVAGRTEA